MRNDAHRNYDEEPGDGGNVGKTGAAGVTSLLAAPGFLKRSRAAQRKKETGDVDLRESLNHAMTEIRNVEQPPIAAAERPGH